ncbi:Protein CBG11081 [Caenorhabditis briggsae]|uniref:Protein CBG11081 n=1 Tax=Caenorhabditis briggsae TaxID=6238 RepID=A8XCD3_CAEBR|nr:Protein CBG11081 [Caenorhabditis briggsae]CAP30300.2 Protein CBG11081 [Caenorhabditis briggsae]
MRKKREKQLNKAKLGSKEGSKESVKGPMVEKKKETELLPEDKTQPTTHSTDSLEFMMPEKTDLKMNKTQPLEDDKTKESKEEIKGSSDEELGEVQLVDHDPDAEMKKEAVKKQAREVAHQKQLAELMEKSLERSESMNPTPDDTMKNVSSIHNESELPEIQKKKRKDYELMANSKFPLLNLPPEIIDLALKSMDRLELICYSFASKKAAKQVKSLHVLVQCL